MSNLTHRIIGLLAETPLHAGSGSSDDVIDLPIQREAHTDWPCIFGSSMKGALRCHAELGGVEQDLITTAFGPDTQNASDHAGALLVGDARLLLLPVRSLTGHYKQVTCPALLQRFLSDLSRAKIAINVRCPQVATETVLVSSELMQNANAGLYLEEFRFDLHGWDDMDSWVELIGELQGAVPGLTKNEQNDMLKSKLAIVDDDSFRHLCRSALPVLPHIKIDSDTKTVAQGALWYEENLSPDTLFYSVLGCQPSRNPTVKLSGDEIITQLYNQMFEHPYLQVGGNETTGMGWCRLAVMENRADG